MRSFHHWTPRYVYDRLKEISYHRAHPDHPWLTRTANEFLDGYLAKTDVGLEFGSGRSTRWFAGRIGHLCSVEHDPIWAAKVRTLLEDANVHNVDYNLIPMDRDAEHAGDAPYVRVADRFAPNSLDFCLVDGVYRDFCAINTIDKIRPGGLLVIDNVNWYLPHASRSPSSRTAVEGPASPVWRDVEQRLSDWRRIWTSSGVTDTAIYVRPCRAASGGGT